MIGATIGVVGSAKGPVGWWRVDEATIGYDHATRLWSNHAVRIDFLDSGMPGTSHAAVELDLASARSLLGALEKVIYAAEGRTATGDGAEGGSVRVNS